jgi:deoxycytidylate deaminase
MEDFFINLARKTAINSELLHKHGSILICDDQIITGYNHFTCNKNSITVHAEEDAINNFILYCRKKYYDDSYIRRRLRKALLITIRIKNNGIKCSAPCKNCIELIKFYGIKQIIYSDIGETNNIILIKKKIRDVENRPSSGYRWRELNNNNRVINL